jgi:glutamate synthase (ferredoxin)
MERIPPTSNLAVSSSAGGKMRAPNLIDPRYEHDSCGTGFVAQISGEGTHRLLRTGLTALARLAHRGAVAADGKSSDGVGIMTAIPRDFLLRAVGQSLPEGTTLGAGVLFFASDDEGDLSQARALETALSSQGLSVFAWRDVPVRDEFLGESARATLPRIRQCLIVCPTQPTLPAAYMEVRLYLARQSYLRGGGSAYIASLSATKLVYKALCAGRLLADFYPDLADPQFVTHFVLFHQRYATNVLPSWERAQPLRMLAHNGEINTVWGNRARMAARLTTLPEVSKPILTEGGSDSTSLDETAELLTRNGRTIAESLRMLIPPGQSAGSAYVRYHTDCVEPWDGPAALAFADGNIVGALLDRNGLRPCRYTITTDGFVIAGSEAGLADIAPEQVAEHGRLGPGEMLVVDFAKRRLYKDHELQHLFDSGGDYSHLLEDQPFHATQSTEALSEPLVGLQRGYGYTREDINLVLTPMAMEGKEAVWSMGDDTPVAPLANSPRSVYSYFRQRFAQVTNPAIDPLREACVFQMRTRLGPWPHLLYKTLPLAGITLPWPLLTRAQTSALREGLFPHAADLPVKVLICIFGDSESLPEALERVAQEGVAAVAAGARILLLTDRDVPEGAYPMPMAMATGAVHHALVAAGLRTLAGIAVEACDAWDVHHIAVLIGHGAGAVCPWLALAAAEIMQPQQGEENYLHALDAGLAKVMAKSGISAVDSYRSAQLFDVLGLREEVVSRCFLGSAGLLSGDGFDEIEIRTRARWNARDAGEQLTDAGYARFRKSEAAERHAWQPGVVRAVQGVSGSTRKATGAPANGGGSNGSSFNGNGAGPWQELHKLVDEQPPAFLRDLLAVRPAGPPISIDEVEPEISIVRRFVASAMSLGSLSPETHQAITDGMALLQGRSNTGEGGEDPELYGAGDESGASGRRDSKIKQVASGRFGVTAQYLAHAKELEIKIAQGSKPGEGGQLPSHKVTEFIARLRHSQPGVALISPPPHHDIYSIEDLAQLIFDLKRVNPRATVGVKLVSSLGVGTVAAGVAKAYADFVVIAGHSGGTGASPLSSIKNAGNPWELGLAETQQVLLANGLRERVRLRVDGGLRTERDVLIAALLGADEFAFGTSVLVALGCDMARQCHLNTCPTGIATQRPELRAKFRGKPENVAQWFLALAAALRQELAALGLPSVEAAIGRTDLLEQVRHDGNLEIAALLAAAGQPGGRNRRLRNDRPADPAVDHEPPDDAWYGPALAAAWNGEALVVTSTVRNHDRTLGARLAGELALHPPPQRPNLKFKCNGTAGQSFGAFAVAGMTLVLTGQANDYVGKGLSGGEIVIRPSGPIASESHRHVILGNVALYGATSGALYAAGRAGERFAVRNSGAIAVVEGLGDHGCEYMTGGMVLVLGGTGINFGAGMTGGEAFVLDEDGAFRRNIRFHTGSVEALSLSAGDLAAQSRVLRALEAHAAATGSRRAELLLQNWAESLPFFVHVRPLSEHSVTAAQPAHVVAAQAEASLLADAEHLSAGNPAFS